MSTLSAALPHSLQNLARWLHGLARLEEKKAPHPGNAASPLPSSTDSSQPGRHGIGGDGHHLPDRTRPASTDRMRPLRGNWPFTVQQPMRPAPASEPKATRARPCTVAPRSFLCPPSGTSSRDAFLASIASGSAPQRSAKAVRKVAHAGGRLVLAGRMADVCAELDRMAASEAVQA